MSEKWKTALGKQGGSDVSNSFHREFDSRESNPSQRRTQQSAYPHRFGVCFTVYRGAQRIGLFSTAAVARDFADILNKETAA